MKADFEKGIKICAYCREELPVEAFFNKSREPDGLNCYCKSCCSKKQREKVVKNKERNKERSFEGIKVCSRCKERLDLSEFYKVPANCSGVSYICKTCSKEEQSKVRRQNTKNNSTPSREGFKLCSCCNERKSLNDFYISRIKLGGFSQKCKLCLRVESKEKWKSNREYYNRKYKEYRDSGRLASYYVNRKKKDPLYKFARQVRTRLNNILNDFKCKKWKSSFNILGCDPEFFFTYIEQLFTEEMTWENHGSYWHLDHIIPLDFFIKHMNSKEGIVIANNYRNLKPLRKEENLEKSNSLPENYEILLQEIKDNIEFESI